MLAPVISSILIQAFTSLLLDNLFQDLAQDQHEGVARILVSSFEDGGDICSLPSFEDLSRPPEIFEDCLKSSMVASVSSVLEDVIHLGQETYGMGMNGIE